MNVKYKTLLLPNQNHSLEILSKGEKKKKRVQQIGKCNEKWKSKDILQTSLKKLALCIN